MDVQQNDLGECIVCNNWYYYDGNECVLKPEENNNVSTTILSTQITSLSIERTTIIKEITTVSTIPKETTSLISTSPFSLNFSSIILSSVILYDNFIKFNI